MQFQNPDHKQAKLSSLKGKAADSSQGHQKQAPEDEYRVASIVGNKEIFEKLEKLRCKTGEANLQELTINALSIYRFLFQDGLQDVELLLKHHDGNIEIRTRRELLSMIKSLNRVLS